MVALSPLERDSNGELALKKPNLAGMQQGVLFWCDKRAVLRAQTADFKLSTDFI